MQWKEIDMNRSVVEIAYEIVRIERNKILVVAVKQLNSCDFRSTLLHCSRNSFINWLIIDNIFIDIVSIFVYLNTRQNTLEKKRKTNDLQKLFVILVSIKKMILYPKLSFKQERELSVPIYVLIYSDSVTNILLLLLEQLEKCLVFKSSIIFFHK